MNLNEIRKALDQINGQTEALADGWQCLLDSQREVSHVCSTTCYFLHLKVILFYAENSA